jgi:orotate phosphoribosyltransferase
MNNKIAVAEKLLQINAIKLSLQQPYTWASGWKSPIYCDNRKALSFPYIRDYIKAEMCNIVSEFYPSAQVLAGVATAGIAWGAMASDQLKLPFIYVRSKPKEHGMGNQIEGDYKPGQKVVVVEDLISTGKSSLDVVDVLRKNRLDVLAIVSIFSYGFKIATDQFTEAGLVYHSLTDYETLISIATNKKSITTEQQSTLLSWSYDPGNWKG